MAAPFKTQAVIACLVALMSMAGCQSVPQGRTVFPAESLDLQFEPHAIPRVGDDEDGGFAEYVLGDTRILFRESKFPEKHKRWHWWQRLLFKLHGYQTFDLWKGYGVDGGFPDTLLTGLEITGSSGSYVMPKRMVTDLGNPNIGHVGTRRKGDRLDLYMRNSDGAGGHYVLYQVHLTEANARRFVRMVFEDDFTETHEWTRINKGSVHSRQNPQD